jgi:hypothetical protein
MVGQANSRSEGLSPDFPLSPPGGEMLTRLTNVLSEVR